ncbi:Cysteine-rich receptor-like protein kinase 2 [Hibiscus syriacus]|uniref:Cysteine-rich receptor-like protein kinase 2 n=1 Tax=Hibiscus syriacus TaxID=106335 RepID=A0A6A2Y529_HIBSY|nr:Cysteine-rich receptor-like protein kinase 2 [Hibiscus syriacus]
MLSVVVGVMALLGGIRGDPRAHTVNISCGHQFEHNSTVYVPSFVATMETISQQMRESGFGTAVTGSGLDTNYGLAQCYGDLSSLDCVLCYARHERVKFSSIGKAGVTNAVAAALENEGYAKARVAVSGTNDSAYALGRALKPAASSAIGVATGVYIWKYRYIQKKRRGSNDAEKFVKLLRDSNLNFKYSTLERATGSFNDANKLGQGGFGTVYKGVLPDGREIAIKRLFFNNRHRAADFYNEVNIISSVEHKNLVRLLGCCCSGPESLLVYEFLPNKSLDRFIFYPSRGKVLNWEKRYEVIIGTVEDQSHISTAIAGTLGYMAPEYLAHGQLTEKVDVYGFGVLLLEIVLGKQNNMSKATEYSDSIVAVAWKRFQLGTVEEIYDPNLVLHGNAQDEVARAVQIGLLCTQEIPSLRPSMSKVLQMLTKKEDLPAPTNPPFMDEKTMEFNGTIESKCYPLNGVDDDSIATVTHSSFYAR